MGKSTVKSIARPGAWGLAAVVVLVTAGTAYAISFGRPGGEWPDSWPKELEVLRKQAWTWEHGFVPTLSFDIPFTERKQFESAWPHILKVKSPGTPITLLRGPQVRAESSKTAGVRIFTGLLRSDGSAAPVNAKPARRERNRPAARAARGQAAPATPAPAEIDHRNEPTVRIELVVDGEIVDLNRIPLPADTLIIDKRFAD